MQKPRQSYNMSTMSTDQNDRTLSEALRDQADLSRIENLLSNGADPTQGADEHLRTSPYYELFKHYTGEQLRNVYRIMTDKSHPPETDQNEPTLLEWATKQNNVEGAKLLLNDRRFDWGVQLSVLKTWLQRGNFDVAQAILNTSRSVNESAFFRNRLPVFADMDEQIRKQPEEAARFAAELGKWGRTNFLKAAVRLNDRSVIRKLPLDWSDAVLYEAAAQGILDRAAKAARTLKEEAELDVEIITEYILGEKGRQLRFRRGVGVDRLGDALQRLLDHFDVPSHVDDLLYRRTLIVGTRRASKAQERTYHPGAEQEVDRLTVNVLRGLREEYGRNPSSIDELYSLLLPRTSVPKTFRFLLKVALPSMAWVEEHDIGEPYRSILLDELTPRQQQHLDQHSDQLQDKR